MEAVMGGRNWTPEEDDLLRKLWNERGSLKVHAKRFQDRNNNALHIRGKVLGLPNRMHLSSDRYSVVRERVAEAFEKGFVGTVKDLASELGECEREVLRRVREGHGEKYRISNWTRKKAFMEWVAVYSMGAEPDAPKPPTQTDREKKSRYNAKRRQKTRNFNPFATAILNVTGVENISPKGQYKSRVYREAA
jgi:hypothetical protein